MGVWAAYDPRLQLIILDTEGKTSELKDTTVGLSKKTNYNKILGFIFV